MDYTPDWSRVVKCGNYVGVYCPDHPRAWSTGYVHIHRIVAEWKLGRLLRDGEVVHHEDDDGHNNSPENIRVFASDADHARHHASLRPKAAPPADLVCAECGTSFQRLMKNHPQNKGYKNAFCSRRCNGIHGRRKQLSPLTVPAS